MIIIFDLHGAIPIYSPCMETFEETMLGSFEQCSNMFRKMCGIYIGDDGVIRLDLMPVHGCVSAETKAERKCEKKLNKVVEKGRNQDVPLAPTGSLAGGTSFDSKFVVYARREDRNAKRFVTLPKTVLNLWPGVARRVTIDFDSGIVIAHELIRGCSKSGLYRALPNGVSRISIVFLVDPSVPAYINVCTVDYDIPEYKYDGTDETYILAAVEETKPKKQNKPSVT